MRFTCRSARKYHEGAMKTVVVLIAIASLAVLGFAPPEKGSCCPDKSPAKAAKKEGCGGCATTKKAKQKCCGKDPFIMEANRMIAASEGRKSTGCACQDAALAKKAAGKPAPKAKPAQPKK